MTGASGYIGRNLYDLLNLFGHRVHCFGRQKSNLNFADYWIKDRTKLTDYMVNHKITGVIHLAAHYEYDHNTADFSQFIDSNFNLGLDTLNSAVKANVEWFLNISTTFEHLGGTYNPVNLYAALKKAFADTLVYYVNAGKIKGCTLRFTDIYGCGDPRKKIINLIRYSKNYPVQMSPGNQLLDLLNIRDVLNGIVITINNISSHYEDYHIKADSLISLKDLVLLIEKQFDFKSKIEFGALPYREREVMRPTWVGKLVPEFEQQISLIDGLTDVFENDINDIR